MEIRSLSDSGLALSNEFAFVQSIEETLFVEEKEVIGGALHASSSTALHISLSFHFNSTIQIDLLIPFKTIHW